MHGGEFVLGPSLLREVAAFILQEPWTCPECEHENDFTDEFMCLHCGKDSEPRPADGCRDGMAGALFWQAAWDRHCREIFEVRCSVEGEPLQACIDEGKEGSYSSFHEAPGTAPAAAPDAGKLAVVVAPTTQQQQQTTPHDDEDADEAEDEGDELAFFDELDLGPSDEEEETRDGQQTLVLELAPQVCGPLGQHLSDGSIDGFRVTDRLPQGAGGILWCSRERAPVTLSARHWPSDFHGEQWMCEKDLLARLIQLGRGQEPWYPESFVLCHPSAETGSLRSQHMAFIGCFVEQQREDPHKGNVWIVKPARDRRSQGITISDDLSVLLGACLAGEHNRYSDVPFFSRFCLLSSVHQLTSECDEQGHRQTQTLTAKVRLSARRGAPIPS